ncbi:Oxygen-independent coproporphyrinogen-III oxidase 1 [Roseovarius sp. THAF9]|uniref:radical SAM family heme chaperone HemW n=1 Tax=Roseovarius sp. THAF9 TaxID=2587847 RepID=UPI001267A9E1|nr:radical SAM family heme chaperone HemW [Roseovarius sp. THAF9]QFT94983.1 Oxygen-independent coproporphyrinogen-III oxidase 1 [Roseovarius sp. THAF9]
MTEDWQAGGFGLYVHWPFCEAKCPYCDFNSHVRANIDQSRWLRAYLRDLDRYADRLPDRVLNSIFFGGGTPSLMNPELVSAIIERACQIWTPANDIEISLEANPGSVEAERFAGFAQAGVNRVSLGVQSLRDDDLRRLGRIHTVAEAIRAFEIARSHFARVSFDLIYARQDQTLGDWRQELSEALTLAVDHLSLYQLTIEPGTIFSQRRAKGGLRGLPSEDLSADMYELTQELCSAAGFNPYEVSNHAKAGAESRHNLVYWRYGDYVGLGPGAHGRITMAGRRYETEAWSNPEQWISHAEDSNPLKLYNKVEYTDQGAEHLLMGLRLTEGIDLNRHAALARKPLSQSKLEDLSSLGLLKVQNGRVSATSDGRLILNRVIADLLED